MSVGTSYSFKDLVGVIANPLLGVTIPLTGGNVGAGTITIAMSSERTVHDVAADGTVMPTYVSGNNGTVTLEVQQTSLLHKELLNAYNLAETLAEQGVVAAWASTTVSIQTLLDGSTHKCTGCSFTKVPDKSYQAHGQKITWSLMAADIVSTGSAVQTLITSLASGLGL
jgi:hypothetical protein